MQVKAYNPLPEISQSLWMRFGEVCLPLPGPSIFCNPSYEIPKGNTGEREGLKWERLALTHMRVIFKFWAYMPSLSSGVFLLNSINLHTKPFSLLLAALLASKLCPPTRTMGTCSGVLANQLFEGQVKNKNKPPNALIGRVYWTFPPWLNPSYQWLNKQLAEILVI